MRAVQTIEYARRRRQYLELLLRMHIGDLVSIFVKSVRRAWGVSVGLSLLVFLFGLVLAGMIR